MASGKEIKRLREKAGLSAEKAANYIGVNADRLRKWEQRDADPKDLDRLLVEKYFGVPIDRLVGLDNFPFVPHETISEEEGVYEKAPELKRALENLTERGKLDAISIRNLTESTSKRDEQIDRLLRILETNLGIPGKGAFQELAVKIPVGPDYGPHPTEDLLSGKKHPPSKGGSDQKGGK